MNIGKCLSLLIFFCTCQIINAQTAEQVIEKYIKAIGGRRGLTEIQTLKYTRKFHHTDSGKVNQTTSYYQKPLWFRWESGDGRRVWIIVEKIQWRGKRDAPTGKMVWDKPRSVRRKPFILKPWGDFINKERDIKFQYIGEGQAGSKKVNHVAMMSESGYRSDLFFDSHTGLLVETRSGSKESRFGLMISKISDYRPVGNVLFPFKEEATRETTDKKFHQINTIIKVEINIPLKKSLFKPPSKK